MAIRSGPALRCRFGVGRQRERCAGADCAPVVRSTHGGIGDAAARVRRPVRRAVPAREAAGRRHQPAARLHLVRRVHRTWPPRVVLQLQHLGGWVVLPVENLGDLYRTLSKEQRRVAATAPSAGCWPTGEAGDAWRHRPRPRPSTRRLHPRPHELPPPPSSHPRTSLSPSPRPPRVSRMFTSPAAAAQRITELFNWSIHFSESLRFRATRPSLMDRPRPRGIVAVSLCKC